jgi:autophagy-related protein 11
MSSRKLSASVTGAGSLSHSAAGGGSNHDAVMSGMSASVNLPSPSASSSLNPSALGAGATPASPPTGGPHSPPRHPRSSPLDLPLPLPPGPPEAEVEDTFQVTAPPGSARFPQRARTTNWHGSGGNNGIGAVGSRVRPSSLSRLLAQGDSDSMGGLGAAGMGPSEDEAPVENWDANHNRENVNPDAENPNLHAQPPPVATDAHLHSPSQSPITPPPRQESSTSLKAIPSSSSKPLPIGIQSTSQSQSPSALPPNLHPQHSPSAPTTAGTSPRGVQTYVRPGSRSSRISSISSKKLPQASQIGGSKAAPTTALALGDPSSPGTPNASTSLTNHIASSPSSAGSGSGRDIFRRSPVSATPSPTGSASEGLASIIQHRRTRTSSYLSGSGGGAGLHRSRPPSMISNLASEASTSDSTVTVRPGGGHTTSSNTQTAAGVSASSTWANLTSSWGFGRRKATGASTEQPQQAGQGGDQVPGSGASAGDGNGAIAPSSSARDILRRF